MTPHTARPVVAAALALACCASIGGVRANADNKVVPQGFNQVAVPWHGSVVQDLHREYGNIFKYGNRNAASHLWSRFLFERAHQMTDTKLKYMFSGFCVVSGSPVRPGDYNRYRLRLPMVTGGTKLGYLHYCCWPCVCDTQDFIRVDTKTIATADGERQYHFAVLGNPCDHPEKLTEPFVQPFYGRGATTLAREAQEVRCIDGVLQGAVMSDNGYVIIGMFFDAVEAGPDSDTAMVEARGTPTPGKVQTAPDGTQFQDEHEYGPMCQNRADNNYNSGMGEIFRKVAAISKIEIPAATSASPAAVAA